MFSSLQLITHKFETCIPRYVHSSVGTFQNIEARRAELMKRGLPKIKPIENINKIVLVASGKGGVGKSTTAVNLAVALKIIHPEKNIGLLDADIFGPSLPLMMNLHDVPLVDKQNKMLPLNNYGVKCMSMGFLIEEGSPVMWRGLMVMQALEKLIRGVNWGPVDCLIIDTPPGTGDTHLSLMQNIPIAGVILVTTPQKASLQVAKRGAAMFNKLKVPIIGLIENMSSVQCPKCLNTVQLFGAGTETLAEEIDVLILEKIPLASEISVSSDLGTPILIQNPLHELSLIYKSLADKVDTYLK